MRRSWWRNSCAARPARIALLFYAGHGMQIDGRNYLVPVDAKVESIGSVVSTMADVDLKVALDGAGASSPFSGALMRHLGTPGLEVQQMLTRVRADVVAVTHNKQVPWSNSSLLGEVFLAGKP
jgi:uncharacterized caspase-like protein